MKINAKLALLFATGSLVLATVASANAASVMTEAFLANVRPNVDFLDRSSRMALTNSESSRIRTFAHDEAMEQTITANSLVAWMQSNTTPGAIGAVVVPGQIIPDAVGLATLPVAIGGDLLTGRSVAIDVPVAVSAAPDHAHDLLPAGQADLDRLSAGHGRPFDALYRTTQLDALRQLQTLYSGYVQNGDDPALRAIAVGELPKINRRISELRRL
jgi:predicted outer membrane protein